MGADSPSGLRPLQVVLAVGALLVVSAGAAVAAAYGGLPARVLLFALAAGAAALSLRASRGGLPSSAETFAACAVGLSLAGSDAGAPGGTVVRPLVLAGVYLALHRVATGPFTWPLAAWLALQVAALRSLSGLPAQLHTPLFLGTALVGLVAALVGRPLVARFALLTSGAWWVAGVVSGAGAAWSASAAQRWTSAALLAGAAAGLILARLRPVLDPLTGPPIAVPVLAGGVAGLGLSGALAALGTVGTTTAGYLGVLLAATAAAGLEGWRRGLFLPVALSAGGVLAVQSLVRLANAHSWGALSLLLVLTSAPAVLVAARRPEDRPVAAPTAVGCLTAAVLLALPAGVLTVTGAAVFLTVLYGLATLIGPDLDPGVRGPTEAAAAVAGMAAVLLLAVRGSGTALWIVLAAQGLCTLGWAVRGGSLSRSDVRAWRAGAAQLVAAAWVCAGTAGAHVLEAYTVPAAVGLLIAAAPRLRRGSSWRTSGPALLVAAVPSALMAVLESGSTRPVLVLLFAAGSMLVGARTGTRAPLTVGAGTAVVVALGLSVAALPWPVTAALALGAVLLAVGARRESSPIPFFGARLGELR